MKSESKIMREILIEGIYQRMEEDRSLFFVSADFGSPRLDMLREKYQERFINVGVAEQNLINISTGLALEGFTVYAYAIAPFLTMRAYEQIRVNLSLHAQLKEVNVNLIGVGAGLSYDVSGPTHHCLEDISIMRTLPNITLFSPSDWKLTEKFIDYSIRIKKPKYLRLDGKPLPQIYDSIEDSEFQNGFKELVKGERVCLVSTGYMTHKALRVANLLNEHQIRAGVIDLFMLKPLNEELFSESISPYDYVITLEEAFINKGGLDSLVTNILTRRNSKFRIKRMGFEDTYVFDMGSREHLHRLNHLDEESIVKAIEEFR
ncbi:MAG: transketolase [Deltaproteobacteria bacterium]|nr:transketolase [Deltaproteobacteria bacterium]